ncbi:alpha-L-fucosidase [Flavivirga aquimarina]|uniref:alpha-L-fucosidase n=1 Tax=Flavivirga aquimarina TaxID=2027862 RepID=A0ABT8W6M7_9FLAO|nr:alpha-L-fucosidase [Flavivirga aquimarina]MDO5968774.1 alpha-L-fucosidase [Flavivirga aquimarina]
MKNKSIIVKAFIPVLICVSLLSCKENKKEEITQVEDVNYLEESKEDFNQRMAWWREAKFGMFIHWGPYSVAGGEYKGETIAGWVGAEWIMNDGEIPIKEYEKFSKQFNPTNFDADAYAKLMKDTGMKYVVITSKHHDGFGLWDSKVSDYDIVDFSPYGKDILKQLSEACKKYGIKFGLYHSIMDWHHPQAQAINEPNYNAGEKDSTLYNPEFPKYYEGYLKVQLKELIDNYDPEILWFDGEWIPEYDHENALDLYQYVRSLKPTIIINNRIDVGRQGLMGMNKEGEDFVGDFGTPEKEVLAGTSTFDWEACMTINDTWGYRKSDHDWKSAKTLTHNLIDAAAKGGNYLLNIGPMGDGTIPQPSLDRLDKIGKWVKVNSEAIFNTEKLLGNYQQGESIKYTKKKGQSVYYGISLVQPKETITFNSLLPDPNSKIMLLGYDEPLEWEFTEGKGVTIKVPNTVLDQVGKTEAWTFKIQGKEIEN